MLSQQRQTGKIEGQNFSHCCTQYGQDTIYAEGDQSINSVVSSQQKDALISREGITITSLLSAVLTLN